MSTIFLDPVQMDATAGHVGEHVNELAALAADLETACSAAVPASIAVWLAEELHEITVTVRMIALVYSLAALDTAVRAQQIQADQSLATAAPSLASTSPTFTGATVIGGFSSYGSMVTGPDYTGGSPLVGGLAPFATSTATSGFTGGASIVGGFFLGSSGGSGGVEMRMQSAEEFRAANPLLAAAERLQSTNPGAAAQLFGVSNALSESRNNSITNNLAPDGLSFVGSRTYEDEFGRRGGLGQTYRDPRTGELRF